MITTKDREEYVKEGGVNCLNCKDGYLEGGEVTVDSGSAWQNIHCIECGASWTDEYILKGVSLDVNE
jgi:hypothetical protein